MMTTDLPEEFYIEAEGTDRAPDPAQRQAVEEVAKLIKGSPERVFFSRQIELIFENLFFHWVTNRAIRELEASGIILSETRPLKSGGTVKLLWNKTYRYYRRDAAEVVKLVEEYADPNIGGALGLHGELMVLEGFAKCQFVTRGRHTNEFGAKK